MTYYDHFVIPFNIGTIILFAVVAYKWVRWLALLPAEDRMLIYRGIPSRRTLEGIGEVFMESLVHRRIWRTNRLLGFMHMSLAFGWFLLIFAGWIETTVMLGGETVPPHAHVFFRYFAPPPGHNASHTFFSFVMDLLLLFVLTGVGLAWIKRIRSRAMGMGRTTKHTWGDRLALGALWFIFPARLAAESVTGGIDGSGGFLTGGIGGALASWPGVPALRAIEPCAWWFYSVVLGAFFAAMPFSRYMHIFTEIPLIFLRRYRVRSEAAEKSFDRFQTEACSRCGICIDPCQLQKDAGIMNVQSVYFLRDRRYGRLSQEVADNCLMCGRCEQACPVGIELNTLRLNSRGKLMNTPSDRRYDYLRGIDRSQGEGKTGYFAGCMTLLTPRILKAMEKIFEAAGEEVWWADRNGGSCCGRPLKLSGELDAARKMMNYNKELLIKHGITTLVASCPICLRVLREDYDLHGIEVLHHSQYILRLIDRGRLSVSSGEGGLYTYHDPCELGRGSGIYDEPREIIGRVGSLLEPSRTRENALCCGSSVANVAIGDRGQADISASLCGELAATGAGTVVTSCPLCKKAIARKSKQQVMDIAEVAAAHIKSRF